MARPAAVGPADRFIFLDDIPAMSAPAEPAPAVRTEAGLDFDRRRLEDLVGAGEGQEAPASGVAATPETEPNFPAPGRVALPAARPDAGSAAASLATTMKAGDVADLSASDFRGDGKAVVVIDTGFSPYYAQRNTVFGYDFSGDGDAHAGQRTIYSHGSWVAQVAVRTARDVDVIHLKVFPDGSNGASSLDIEEALRWVVRSAADHDVAAVNLSLGFGNATRATRTHLSDEFRALDAMGVISVVSAGNEGETYERGVNVLAADPNVIGVSATTREGRLADFSQRSGVLTDICALGDDVFVRTNTGLRGWVSGTSFSAPYVAAAAARLQQAAEALYGAGARLDDDDFLEILRASGDRVAGAPAKWGGAVDADADAAVDWFLAHHADYADALFA